MPTEEKSRKLCQLRAGYQITSVFLPVARTRTSACRLLLTTYIDTQQQERVMPQKLHHINFYRSSQTLCPPNDKQKLSNHTTVLDRPGWTTCSYTAERKENHYEIGGDNNGPDQNESDDDDDEYDSDDSDDDQVSRKQLLVMNLLVAKFGEGVDAYFVDWGNGRRSGLVFLHYDSEVWVHDRYLLRPR